jgi:hypothetical protein
MEESINLIEDIFSGNFFNPIPQQPTSEFISGFAGAALTEVKSILGESFYISSPDKNLIGKVGRFFKSLDFNFKSFEILEKKNKLDLFSIHKIAFQNTTIYIPDTLYRKIAALLSGKKENLHYESIYIDFIIRTGGFPYNIVRFLENYDNITIQKIVNSLLSENLADEKMLFCFVKASNDKRILSNIPKNISKNISETLISGDYSSSWIKNGLYQLSYNTGLIADKIDFQPLNDFKRIESYILHSEVKNNLDKIGFGYFLKDLEKKRILQKVLSIMSNKNLAVIIKTGYGKELRNYFSKRRKLMIEEEREYLESFDNLTFLKSISLLFETALNIQFETHENKTEMFRNYIINLAGEKDFKIIYSRLNPIDFALSFKPLSKKLQNYVLSKLDIVSSSYLSDIFSGRIKHVSSIDKGWLIRSREKFLYTCYRLENLGVIKPKAS